MSTFMTHSPLIGESRPVRGLRSLIATLAPSKLPVLIQGPTGAGKELVARELHRLSCRDGMLVAFNVCATSETMFEDALFGHVRGAFTGAERAVPGLLAQANRGTLFLDEIGTLSLAMQAKLLRAIETGEFRVIGATVDRQSDFRVVAATNADIQWMVEQGTFREDLAHRLGGYVISIPPLRSRADDVPLLVSHFAQQATSRSGRPVDVEPEAMALFATYDWPGNVRELRLTIERAVLLCGERGTIGRLEASTAIENGYLRRSRTRVQHGAATTERLRILAALEDTGGDTALAASQLGMHRGTLYKRMRALSIPLPRLGRLATGR